MFRVVAVIAAVLLASSAHAENLVEIAAEIGSFKTLIRALEVADLKESLSAEGPYTLFAPTDDAFTQIPAATLENLMRPENRPQLVMLLKHHVLSGNVVSREWSNRKMEAVPLAGKPVILDARKQPKIGPARIVRTDMIGDNGVMHVIDTVLVPADIESAGTAR
ncbi:MAG: fasciclin domain-containing protein [Alphaproteobacteria bacterium]|nr:fasciclin domain-containing protein [Alphaproteobacteria bacterium]